MYAPPKNWSAVRTLVGKEIVLLKLLVRCAGVGLAILVTLLSGVYMVGADLDGMPDRTHVASVRLDASSFSRSQITAAIDEFANANEIEVFRVASPRDDFLNKRVAFRFGESGSTDSTIDFFLPSMSGTVDSYEQLGNTSLSGVYSFDATADVALAFRSLIVEQLEGEATLAEKTTPTLLRYTFLAVGAWVPFLASLLLLVTTAIAWYAIRARRRELSLLNGVGVASVVLTDLRTLLQALTLPAVGTCLLLLFGAWTLGFGRVVLFASVIGVGLLVALAFCLIVAGALAIVTVPSVATIASREPAGSSLWGISEAARAMAILVVVLLVPVTVPLLASAQVATERSAIWEAFGEAVTVRIDADLSDAAIEVAFGELVRNQLTSSNATYSTSLTSSYLNVLPVGRGGEEQLAQIGFDSIVMVDDTYLGRLGVDVQTLGLEVGDLPAAVAEGVGNNLAVWADDSADLGVVLAAVAEGARVPVFSGTVGVLEEYDAPLILVVANPAAFNNQFLTSALSRGDLAILEPSSLEKSLRDSGLSSRVLSVDRLSDVGLYDAQTQWRGAQLALSAVGLAVLALLIGLAVNSWIRALRRRRRIFVQRTAGVSWFTVLRESIYLEGAFAVSIVLFVFVWTSWTQPSAPAWSFAIMTGVIYLLIALAAHWVAVRSVFNGSLVRRG